MTERQELRLSAALVAVLVAALALTMLIGAVRGVAAGPNMPPTTTTEGDDRP